MYQQRKFHARLCFSKKEFAIVSNLRISAGQISCSAELSMKKSFKTSGPVLIIFGRVSKHSIYVM